jgi:hypothetical protein
MASKPKVFICSCLNELRVERARAFDAVNRLGSLLKRWTRVLNDRHTVCGFINEFDLARQVALNLAKWHAKVLEQEALALREKAQNFVSSFLELEKGLDRSMPASSNQIHQPVNTSRSSLRERSRRKILYNERFHHMAPIPWSSKPLT